LKVAIIGRTEVLYETACNLRASGHEIVCIVTSKEAREYMRNADDFRNLAIQWNIPFICSPTSGECYSFLSSKQADIAISINYASIIPAEIVNIFPHGILNAHGGDLPRYRGNACQAWAILNGEKRIGVCIHKMIGNELDSGDIIARDYMLIDDTTKITNILAWMRHRIPQLMIEAIEKLAYNTSYILESQSKDPKNALRCYPRRPEDGKIDWKKSAIEILRLINASNKPYAGAFCEFENERLIIWDAELAEEEEAFCAIPGQITIIGEGFVEVVCGAGKLKLLEIEFEGRIAAPSEIIHSIRKRLS
jgi:methionyl-tRNA formyltransferase